MHLSLSLNLPASAGTESKARSINTALTDLIVTCRSYFRTPFKQERPHLSHKKKRQNTGSHISTTQLRTKALFSLNDQTVVYSKEQELLYELSSMKTFSWSKPKIFHIAKRTLQHYSQTSLFQTSLIIVLRTNLLLFQRWGL